MIPQSNCFCHHTLILTGQSCTPLIVGGQKGHKDVCQMLIQHGAEVNHQHKVHHDMTWYMTMHCWFRKHVVLVVYIILLCCLFQDGWSPLHSASAHGHPSIVELLIKSGAQLDIQTKVHYSCWETTLHWAWCVYVSLSIREGAFRLSKTSDTTFLWLMIPGQMCVMCYCIILPYSQNFC